MSKQSTLLDPSATYQRSGLGLDQHPFPSLSAQAQALGLIPVFSGNLQLSYFASKFNKLAIHISIYHSTELTHMVTRYLHKLKSKMKTHSF